MSNIKLYSNGCPKCKILKTKLQNKCINFIESQEIEKLISEGYKSLPILEANGKLMDFINANIWVNERSSKNEN